VESANRQAHWDARYRTAGANEVSWYEEVPRLSLELVELVGATTPTSLIDVGGGASRLCEELLRRGFADLTVLDVSREALDEARGRLVDPDAVTWIQADVLAWRPPRRWRVWHDRALFHFLTDPADRRTYRGLLRQAVEPGGAVIISTFAEDGPRSCSGLPVERYAQDSLFAEIGEGFSPIGSGRVDHITPAGATQTFTWIAARARPA